MLALGLIPLLEFPGIAGELWHYLIAEVGFALALALVLYCGGIALEIPPTLENVERNTRTNPLDGWLASRLRNPLDTIWLRFLVALTALMAPAFIGILLPTLFGVHSVLLYSSVFALSFNAINAFEHTNSHNHFFRSSSRSTKLDKIILSALRFHSNYVLNIMYARIPNWYRVQHVAIHHVEDNGPEDTQSTLPYDRSSFIDFSICANRFAWSGILSIDIIQYLTRNKRLKPLRDVIAGSLVFYGVLLVIAFLNWPTAICLLAFRFAGQLITTLGFFHEHGMIDITDPKNIYRNSLNYLTADNAHASLGDDAHIEHHLHRAKHWSEYALDVEKNRERYRREGALGFLDGPGNPNEYFKLIWRNDFQGLAKMFVVYGKEDADIQEIASILQVRVQPSGSTKQGFLRDSSLAYALGYAAGYLLPWWQENGFQHVSSE